VGGIDSNKIFFRGKYLRNHYELCLRKINGHNLEVSRCSHVFIVSSKQCFIQHFTSKFLIYPHAKFHKSR
jgi:hypothetical protein